MLTITAHGEVREIRTQSRYGNGLQHADPESEYHGNCEFFVAQAKKESKMMHNALPIVHKGYRPSVKKLQQSLLSAFKNTRNLFGSTAFKTGNSSFKLYQEAASWKSL